MLERPWFQYAAVGTIGLALLLFLAPFPVWFALDLIITGGSFALSAFSWWQDHNRYSLRKLEKVHAQMELREVQEAEMQPDSVLCVRCGHVYSPEFPMCPNCAQPWK